MIVRAARHQIETVFQQLFGQGFRIFNYLLRVSHEFRRIGFGHRNGYGCHCMHVRAALQTWKNGFIHVIRMFFFAQEHAPAGTSQSFMSCG